MRRLRSPDLDRPRRIPPGQHRTDKFPVLSLTDPPEFDPLKWRLKIWGAVENPCEWTWDEFLRLPAIEVAADFHCVTQWSRLDNVWTGVSTAEIRDRAKPRASAACVLQHGLEGYTTNLTPDEFFAEDVLLAYRHDGQWLSPEHGAPLRVITPRLYAWKGAKFLTGLEFLEQERPGYWEQRGYHRRGDPWKEERFWGDEK